MIIFARLNSIHSFSPSSTRYQCTRKRLEWLYRHDVYRDNNFHQVGYSGTGCIFQTRVCI